MTCPSFDRGGPDIRRVRETGFTLLEILIGLSLLAVMMTLLFGTVRMGARVWDKGEARAADIDRTLIIQNFLRQHLTRARPVHDDFSEPDEPVFAFSGTEETLRFVSLLPDSAGRGGMHQFELAVEELDDDSVMVLKLTPFYPPLEGAEVPIEDVRLLRGVDRIEIAYFGIDEESDEAEDADWQDSWEEKEFMPELVRVVIYLKNGKQWPPLIVRPVITEVEQDS